MATLSLTWNDSNLLESGFNIYRSETPMDIENMPSPIDTVGENVGSYDDTTGVVGTLYYYRIGVVRGTEEKISEEIIRYYGQIIDLYDVFNDSSAMVTYQFDGDAMDLGGTYNGTWNSTPSYVPGKFNNAANFDGSKYMDMGFNHTSRNSTISMWVNCSSLSVVFVSQTVIFNTSNGLDVFNNNSGTGSIIRYTVPQNPQNTWFHLVISFDDNVPTMYFDGIEQTISGASSSYSSTRRANTTLCYDQSAGYGVALIDQFRMFNRPLNSDEVLALYTGENF